MVNTGNEKSDNPNTYELVSNDKSLTSNSNTYSASGELGGGASIGYSDKYETSLNLSSQIVQLSGYLSDNKLLLRQEGGAGIDLTGNIVVLVEYALTVDWAPPVNFFKIKNLYASDGSPNPLGSIKTSFLTVLFPDIQNNITGEVDYTFIYRQVRKGNRHLPEARQKVKYMGGHVDHTQNPLVNTTPLDLVKKEDIRPKVYKLQRTGSGHNLSYNSIEMGFESASEALTFLSYLEDLSLNGIGFSPINLNGVTLLNADIPNLRVITIQL